MRCESLILVALVSACATPPPAPPAPAPDRDARRLVEVTAVAVAVSGASPPSLSIRVNAVAPTPGYSNLTLRPFNYIQAPPDGIYDFTAVGTPPDKIVAQVLKPVEFTYAWPSYPARLKGVRVHGAEGAVTTMLPGAR